MVSENVGITGAVRVHTIMCDNVHVSCFQNTVKINGLRYVICGY